MRYVLALSIGPVAGFIAAGRRSRDIWYGSTWLSETTRAVAGHLLAYKADGVTVDAILPRADRLAALDEEYRQNRELHGGRVSNKVLALVSVPDGAADAQETLREVARSCRERAREVLCGELSRLKDERVELGLDLDAFDRQVRAIRDGDFMEFSAGWAPAHGADVFTGRDVKRACELRDAAPKLFTHPSFSRRGVSRSDLDEGRDTVLVELGQRALGKVRVRRERAGLVENEALDAVGLLRRARPYLRRRMRDVKHEALPFPPLSRVAADPWIEGRARAPETRRVLGELRAEIERARKSQDEDFFIWCSPAADGRTRDDPASFRFDAGTLFEGACDALLASVERIQTASGGEWPGAEDVRAALRAVSRHVRRLHALAGEPIQYYAFIELDGDRVGALLAAQDTQKKYDAVVRALDEFAAQAAKTVEGEHGAAFYVAGDELAAYVPLDRALDVVKALADLFAEKLPGQTVSAGVVIAHVKDDLRGVRVEATRALKEHAKAAGGDRVCVREMPRAGSDRVALGRIRDLHGRFEALVEAIDGGHVSLRTEQHLRDHLDRFGDVAAVNGSLPGVELAKDAVRRQFERAGRDDAKHPLTARIDALETWEDVARLADEIRIASRVADVRAQRREP